MTTDDQDEKITLASLLRGIWPRNPFMVEIARRTPTTLREFMDQADGFINAKDTLEAPTASHWTKMETTGQRASHDCERGRKGVPDACIGFPMQWAPCPFKSSGGRGSQTEPTEGIGPS